MSLKKEKIKALFDSIRDYVKDTLRPRRSHLSLAQHPRIELAIMVFALKHEALDLLDSRFVTVITVPYQYNCRRKLHLKS